MPEYYFTIDKKGVAEFKDRGSKFIAYAFPISGREEFKARLAGLKKEHPRAAHHCFGYRIGTDGNNFRVSDDGEPSGSAGRPILGQIDSKQLTNIAVIVVRYFGGTLLGVPGLINAYKTATAMAIESSIIIQKPVLVEYGLQFDYTKMNDVMRVVKIYDCDVLEMDTQLFCTMKLGIPQSKLSEAVIQLNEIKGVEIKQGDS